MNTSKESEEEPTCRDNRVRINHVAEGHEIVNHDVSQCYQGKSEQPEINTNSMKDIQQISGSVYPWTAPRVLARYLALRMQSEWPIVWTVDDYDGLESWEEEQQDPPEEYREDAKATSNQHPKMTHELYQLENMTDELLKKWHKGENEDVVTKDWKKVKTKVQQVCMRMNHEIMHEDNIEIDNREKHGQQLQMFEKGTRKTRQPVCDDYSDEEDAEQFVCNMTGSCWESLPFPIIVDSGACASVMSTGWCDHVLLKENQQSRAGEFFRAANGQKIHNHGERTVSIMTREGTMRDMRFTVCDVSKAIGSVSQMCKTGHRVVFNPPWDPEGPFIQHVVGSKNKMGFTC